MTTELAQKLEGVRDFRKILETVVKELGETYSADVSQIVLSNPLDHNTTSICEYKLYPEANASDMPVSQSFPLPLQGVGLGVVSLARQTEFHENEVNWIRITLAELCDVIRHAQINDVVQRDTFRNTFLYEIQNVMNYSLGIGDALFMVVNILGKVLNVSRCLFVCVDDTHAGWKAYEFWQRERVQSCQEYGWPTTDSPIVARSLLASAPLLIEEANQNSYLTPVQAELQLLGVRSMLGVPLRSENSTHGCIILQHCDSRHDWTRGELDMVQNVADTVAEALAKLPEEKRAHEPIMRLHQREVIDTAGGDAKESILAVRRALRHSLGQTSIPSAQKTTGQSAKPSPPAPAKTVVAPTPTPQPAVNAQQIAASTAPVVSPTPTPVAPQVNPPQVGLPPVVTPGVGPTFAGTPVSEDVMATIGQLANSLMHQAGTDLTAEEVSASLHSILGGMGNDAAASAPNAQVPSQPPITAQPPVSQQPAAEVAGESPWGNLDSIAAPSTPPPAPTNGNGGLGGGAWGDLDSIPTPAAGSAKGLSSMLGKRSANNPNSPLLASLHRDKSKFQQQVEYVDGGEIQIDEVQAEAKLKQIMQQASSSDTDYIYALTFLDPRMLARIDAWVTQVEEKDKYASPHAIHVAEYSKAVARLLGLPQAEVDAIQLAGIMHDVGKMGLPAQILQKPEDELEDNELLWIMKHPIDGATLLEGFSELAHLAPIVLAHHEEYDGNGYPAGLAGEQIPLAARIVHVASDYHKMISPTRLGPGISPEQAQQALRANAGKMYDPAVVEALIACEQQGLVAAAGR